MMAYFGSNYYEAEPGIYLPTPYGGGYDFAPSHHALAPYSCYEFNEPSFFQYGPNPFVGAYDPAPNRSTISYSVSTVSQSELVVYDPTPYGGGYDPFHTQFTVSYNKSGFNEPDFEEYDPTPYGGGYDIAQTYGKPLPPSDEICYPRDAPQAIAPSLDPLPGGKKEEDHESASEPQKGSQPSKASEEEQEQQSHGGTEDVLNRGYENGHGSNLGEPLGSSQSREIEGNYYDDYYPWTGYEYDYGNGRSDKHENEKQVPQDPWGYSPEAMDFCESIFGHWPCLYKQKMYGHQGTTNEERSSNQWKGTEDFIFGSSYPYTHQKDEGGSHGDAIYGYERHYQEQPHYPQVENEENSWLKKFSIF